MFFLLWALEWMMTRVLGTPKCAARNRLGVAERWFIIEGFYF